MTPTIVRAGMGVRSAGNDRFRGGRVSEGDLLLLTSFQSRDVKIMARKVMDFGVHSASNILSGYRKGLKNLNWFEAKKARK